MRLSDAEVTAFETCGATFIVVPFISGIACTSGANSMLFRKSSIL